MEIKEQVAVAITNTVEIPVEVINTIEKIIQVTHTNEKLVEVPVERTISLVKEVPKPYREEVQILVKGDTEEVFV